MDDICIRTRIGKSDYKANCPQRAIYRKLRYRGIDIHSGQSVRYIIVDALRGVYIPAEDFRGQFDLMKYTEMLKKGLVRVLSPLGMDMEMLDNMMSEQKLLCEYLDDKKIRLMLEKDSNNKKTKKIK